MAKRIEYKLHYVAVAGMDAQVQTFQKEIEHLLNDCDYKLIGGPCFGGQMIYQALTKEIEAVDPTKAIPTPYYKSHL